MQAIEQVTHSQRDRLRALDVALDTGDDSQGESSLELNVGLAQFYKGRDANQLRGKAIEREIHRQQEQKEQSQHEHQQKKEGEPNADMMVITVSDDEPESVPLYEIKDSSDDERSSFVRESATQAQNELSPKANTEAEDPPSDTLVLTLQGARQLEDQVRVRPTTLIKTILSHFVQKHASALDPEELKSIFVTFEGERLDPQTSVEALELEDDVQLDVMW